MCAIGRALMANPSMVLLDEPSMGLAPQIVEEVFNIVKDLNSKEKVTFLLAEQNTNMALKYADYGYIMESGRVVMDGAASDLASNEDVKEFYLGGRRRAQELQGRQELQAPQALAGLIGPRFPLTRPWRWLPRRSFSGNLFIAKDTGPGMSTFYDALETRSPAEREAA
jgi:ABC-type multidrug transport system ATPase subunit